MKTRNLKRLMALLLALAMMLGCFSALAEETAAGEDEAAETAAPATFWENLSGRLRSMDLTTHQLRLVVPIEYRYYSEEPTVREDVISLQTRDGVTSLLLTAGDQTIGELQTDGQTIWVATGDRSYGMDVSVAAELIQDFLGTYPYFNLLTSEDFRTALSVNLTNLWQYVLGRRVTVARTDDGSTAITLMVNGTQLAEGLADYVESIANAESIPATLGMRQGSVDLLMMMAVAQFSASQGVNLPAQYDAAYVDGQARSYLRQTAQQLRSARIDLTVFGVATIGRDGSCTVNGTVTTGGSSVNVEGSYTDGSLALRVYDSRTEYASLNAHWSDDGETRRFDCTAVLGAVTVTAAGTLDEGAFRMEVTAANGEATLFRGSLTGVKNDDSLLVTVSGTDGRNPVTGELFATRTSLTAKFLSGRTGVDFDIARNAEGGYPCSLRFTDGYSALNADWNCETLTVVTNDQRIAITPHEISASQYAIDFESASRYDGYQTREGRLLLTLTEGGEGLFGMGNADGWTLTLSAEQNGTAESSIRLEYTAQRNQTPIANEQTVMLDRATVLQMLWTTLSGVYGGAYNGYGYDSYPVYTVDAYDEVTSAPGEDAAAPVVEYTPSVDESGTKK